MKEKYIKDEIRTGLAKVIGIIHASELFCKFKPSLLRTIKLGLSKEHGVRSRSICILL